MNLIIENRFMFNVAKVLVRKSKDYVYGSVYSK